MWVGFAAEAATGVACPALPDGMLLRGRLDQDVATATHRPGDRFTATLAEPLHDGRRVLVRKGARVYGRVQQASPSDRLSGRAVLTLVPERLEWNGGSIALDLRARTRTRTRHRRRSLTWIGGGSGAWARIGARAAGGAGAAIGAEAGAMAGLAGAAATGRKHVWVPAETLLTFRLLSPAHICQIQDNTRR